MQKSVLEDPQTETTREGWEIMSQSILNSLKAFGATDDDILLFDPSDYRSINYLNLLVPVDGHPLPEGVILSGQRPVLYFMNATNLAIDASIRANQIHNVVNILACRGEVVTLAVVSHGQITVFPVRTNEPIGEGLTAMGEDESAGGFIRDIIEGALPTDAAKYLYGENAGSGGVDDILFSLLMRVGHDLNATEVLRGQHETILALVGRALLTRFLIDRQIITPDTFPQLYSACSVADCFYTPENAALTNDWLDNTFNGDLLPLPAFRKSYEQWFATLDTDVFKKLSFIIGHADEYGQLPLPGFINFAYVPVGLLSEVYERYAHENLEDEVRASAKRESIHYTPRHIADYMISQAFDAVTTSERHLARVLDPSCGAGVFVVLAFRRLIAEHWAATEKQPDTFQIRDILYEQICGFDINSSALTLAALGLYLSALELDPEPLPTSKLKFKSNLLGSILHCVRGADEPWNTSPAVMGSLGPLVGAEHSWRYDIVIGNPPWSSFPEPMNTRLSNVARNVALKRDSEYLADVVNTHENPDQVPDLPFVWKSMEWAKPGGMIALALHARLLFKNSPVGIISRNHLFKALNITGILNAAALRQSNVWPRINAQFCLLFAKNEIPSAYNYFSFVSPQFERELNNRQGRLRVDYQSAEPVQAGALAEKPHLLKTLYKGTALDAEVMDRIASLVESGEAIKLHQYWDKTVGENRHGQGYQVASKSKDASFIIEMGATTLTKTIEKTLGIGYLVDASDLPLFDEQMLHRPKTKGIYEGPLLLFNESPGQNRKTRRCKLSFDDRPIAYNESYIGYSAHGLLNPDTLLKYLFVLGNSDFFIYYMLMTSSKYGVEREVLLKEDFDAFPIIPFEQLPEKERNNVVVFAEQLISGRIVDWNEVNSCVNQIYGLNEYDTKVICDTLSVSLPTAESKKKAQQEVSSKEIEGFCNELSAILEPHVIQYRFDDVSNAKLHSWRFVSISPNGEFDSIAYKDALTEIAHHSGASRVIITSDNCLHIGMLNQYRYWTPSRARLLALHLLRDHTDFLEAD